MVHAPYKGVAPALADLLSGQIQTTFNPASVVLPHIKSGRVRGLRVTSAKRPQLAPELPTIAEAGVPGYEATGWYGVLAPANMPPAIITRLSRELTHVLADKDVKDRFSATGVEPIGTTPQQFAEFIRNEYVKCSKVVRAAGVNTKG